MRKRVLTTVLVLATLANAAPFKITIARVGDSSIQRDNDKSFAASFNYHRIEEAYPYVSIDGVRHAPTNADLQAACKKAVLKGLKSPGAAQFVEIRKATYSIPGGIYFVGGKVDSQNSYGALLRGRFACSTAFQGDTKGGTLYTLMNFFEGDGY